MPFTALGGASIPKRHHTPRLAAPLCVTMLQQVSAVKQLPSSHSDTSLVLACSCRLPHHTSRPPHRLVLTASTSSAPASAPAPAPAPDPAPPVTPLYKGKKAVVVGAGPAGSAAAMFLARQGFRVDVSR